MSNGANDQEVGNKPSIKWLLLFVIGSLLAYSSILTNFFVSDDLGILQHMDRNDPWNVYPAFIRPVVCASFFVDFKLWGVNPIGFHLTSLLVHGLNSWAVYAIALILFERSDFARSRRSLLALGAGAMFLLMPGRTEAVSWISGRPDMLATFFALYAFLEYLRFKQGANARVHLAISAVLYSCSILSKESVLAFPVMIALFEVYGAIVQRQRGSTSAIRQLVNWRVIGLYGALLLGYLVVRFATLGALVGGYGEDVHLTFRPLRILKNVFTYPSRPLIPSLSSPELANGVAAGILIVIALVVLWAKRRRREGLPSEVWVAIAAFFVAALPIMNLSISKILPAGERLLYWSSAYLAIGMVALLGYVVREKRWTLAILLPLLATFGVLLYRGNLMWECSADFSHRVLVRMSEDTEPDYGQRYLVALFEAAEETKAIYGRRRLVFAWSLLAPPQDVLDCLIAGNEDCSSEDLSGVVPMFDF